MTYRAGVVGVGRVGRNHAEAFLDAGGVELGAVADVDERTVAELGAHWGLPGARRYTDHRAMLADERLDVVSVATPAGFHHEHVLDAARAADGPAVVVCEKPIATTVGAAEEMVAACEAAGVELVVNHSRRFATALGTLRELLHERDLLGELRAAHLAVGPELLNLGTHYLDLLLYVFDARVRDVRGGHVETVETDDGVRFEGGGTFLLDDGTVAHLGPVGGAAGRLYVEGSTGRLSVPLSVARDAATAWRYWRLDEEDLVAAPLPEPLQAQWEADVAGTHSTYEPGMVPAQALFEAAVAHVVDLLDGRAENASPGSVAAHGLSALVATVVSDATGARVPLPLADPFTALPLEVGR